MTYVMNAVLVVTAIVYWNCNLVLMGVGRVVVTEIAPALIVGGGRVVYAVCRTIVEEVSVTVGPAKVEVMLTAELSVTVAVGASGARLTR